MANGAPLAIAIDVLTFWVAAVALALLPIRAPKRADLGGFTFESALALYSSMSRWGESSVACSSARGARPPEARTI